MMRPIGGTPEQLRQLMASEITRWKPIIEAAKVKVN
jgi:tripartite-type tricarboxylate transporter receptor subunit TctC